MCAKERVDEDLLEDDDENEDTQEGKYLTFQLNEEEYGIEIGYVTEIIGLQNINVVPDMPHYIRGVINLRGKVIPVMDVRLRFGAPERQYDERTCIIVINVKEQSIGLIVDMFPRCSTFRRPRSNQRLNCAKGEATALSRD